MNDFPDEVERDPHGTPPRDVVPGRRLDREQLLDLNANAGRQVYLHMPGEVIEDWDGVPMKVGPTTVQRATLVPTPVTRALLAELGVDPSEVPNLKIID